MGNRLQEKVAAVFGAGSIGPGWGNGKATAVAYAREGAKIAAIDVNLIAAEETRGIIEGEGGACIALQCDVSDSASVKRAVDQVVEHFGRIDILHNNVGIVEFGGPVEASEEGWDRVMDVNLKGMFLTCKHVIPFMEKQSAGAIVNISSLASIRWGGVPYISYNASKAGVNQLTRTIARQYAKKGIRANAILPGLMDTPMIRDPEKVRADGLEAFLAQRNARCPMGHMGDGWAVAWASVFLASDEAKYITGVLLPVDGGLGC